MQCRPSKQRGVALLTAMFVVFLATFASVELVYSLQLAINRSAVVLGQRQAWYYAIGGEAWALDVLREDQEEDARSGEPAVDWRGEDWATALQAVSIEGGSVSGSITDLQGRFNINNLVEPEGGVDEAQVNQFRLLLRALGVEAEAVEALPEAVTDWIDSDSITRPLGGAETSEYLLETPPYRAPNAPIVDVSELRLVKGMTAETMALLRDHVCALPPGTRLNVNTASKFLLMSLHADISETLAESLVRDPERSEEAYPTEEDFLEQLGGVAEELQTAELRVVSSFFEANVQVSAAFGDLRLRSVLQRVEGGPPRVVSRSLVQPQ